MAAVDVALVRVEDGPTPVPAHRHVFDLELARCEQPGVTAGCGNRVQMQPAVTLPRKDDAVAVAPAQLILGNDAAKGAAPTRLGPPDFPARTARHVGHTDGPGLGRPARTEGERSASRRRSDKGDAPPVRGPDGLAVEIDSGIQPGDALAGALVDADEAVVAAPAHEDEAAAVGRPAERAEAPPGLDETLGLALGKRRPPDVAPFQKRQPIARGGQRRGRALADPLRSPAGATHHPDLTADSGRQAPGVGVFPSTVRAATAHVHDGAAVHGEAQVGERLAVVLGVTGQLARLVCGPLGDPDVTDAPGVEHPSDLVSGRGGGEAGGEGGAHDLFQRETLLAGKVRDEEQGERRGEGEAAEALGHRRPPCSGRGL